MMYFCPCSCDDPIDPETEENAFFALPRNLSYVQDSYLDRYSVSSRFVHSPKLERNFQLQQDQEWKSNVEVETLGLLSAITAQELSGRPEGGLDTISSSGFDFSQVDGLPGAPSNSSGHSTSRWTDGQSSPLSSSFKASSFFHPASVVAAKISAFLHSPPNETMDSARNLGTSVDGDCLPLTPEALTKMEPLVVTCPDDSGTEMDRGDCVITESSATSPESDNRERDILNLRGDNDTNVSDEHNDTNVSDEHNDTKDGATDEHNINESAIYESDNNDSGSAGHFDNNESGSDNNSDNTHDSEIAISSGLFDDNLFEMDLEISFTSSHEPTNNLGDAGTLTKNNCYSSTFTSNYSTSQVGLSGKTQFYEADPNSDGENTEAVLKCGSEDRLLKEPMLKSFDVVGESDTSEERLPAEVCEEDCGSNVATASLSTLYGSPDSDAFSEEGVFVNTDDLDSTHEKSTTVSDASDDTCISADSMFMSPDEGELEDEEAGQEPARKMTLQEAINRAASDLNKLSLEIYGSEDTLVVSSNRSSNLSLSESGTDFKVSSRLENTPDRSSPIRISSGLKLKIELAGSGSDSRLTDSSLTLTDSPVYPDQEFNFSRVELRKSSSLKSNKTPPGTPHRKKVVRFADAMGLDLESVRHVLNMESPPKIPASALADLVRDPDEESLEMGSRYLCPCFSQPGAAGDFFTRVSTQKVSLENAVINDLTITGFVRVSNISYHKTVRVRYTHSAWSAFYDIAASYVQNSCDGPTDRFSFSIVAPPYFAPGSRLEFAICYIADGVEYWDNNEGRNYVFECFAKSIPTDSETAWLHFL